ncbi:hypothetical protein [Demequina subtropica]|uniref:hypothetical protein n=1 Tax=Demequina subtropica TaxID=1638989 RepID=UPI0007852284|nr:hypothetical protein [Demequina subtropica]
MDWSPVPREDEIPWVADVDHYRIRIWGRPVDAGYAWNRDDWKAPASATLDDVLAWARQRGVHAVIEVFAVLVPAGGPMLDARQSAAVRVYGAPPAGADVSDEVMIVAERDAL